MLRFRNIGYRRQAEARTPFVAEAEFALPRAARRPGPHRASPDSGAPSGLQDGNMVLENGGEPVAIGFKNAPSTSSEATPRTCASAWEARRRRVARDRPGGPARRPAGANGRIRHEEAACANASPHPWRALRRAAHPAPSRNQKSKACGGDFLKKSPQSPRVAHRKSPESLKSG